MDPCCRHVMLGVVSSGEEGEGLLMLDVACNMGQHGLLGCCVKGARGSPLMLDVACNMGRLDFDLMVELLRTMCGSRTGGWSLLCVMSD
jgi:hypothetical protein